MHLSPSPSPLFLEKFGACRFQFSTRRNGPPSGSMKLSTRPDRNAPAVVAAPFVSRRRLGRFSTAVPLHAPGSSPFSPRSRGLDAGFVDRFRPSTNSRRPTFPSFPSLLFLPPSSLHRGRKQGGTSQRRRISFERGIPRDDLRSTVDRNYERSKFASRRRFNLYNLSTRNVRMLVLGCRPREFPAPGRRTGARTCRCSRSAPWPTSCSPAAWTRATYLMRSRTPPAWATTRPAAPGTRDRATTQSASR